MQNPVFVKANRLAVSNYREDKSLRMIKQQECVALRIASAKVRRDRFLQSRRGALQGFILKKELLQLFQKEFKKHTHRIEAQIIWIHVLVASPHQKYLGVILAMREMFDDRVREVDYFTDLVKGMPDDVNYFKYIKIFRM